MCHISVVYKKKTYTQVFLVKKNISYLLFYLFKSTSLHKSQLGNNVVTKVDGNKTVLIVVYN